MPKATTLETCFILVVLAGLGLLVPKAGSLSSALEASTTSVLSAPLAILGRAIPLLPLGAGHSPVPRESLLVNGQGNQNDHCRDHCRERTTFYVPQNDGYQSACSSWNGYDRYQNTENRQSALALAMGTYGCHQRFHSYFR